MKLRNLILVLLPLFSTATAYSQQASIYGIPFGSTFSKVERMLDQKMFTGKYITPDYSILEYHDVNMAGIIFGSLIISFQYTGNDNIMNKASFTTCYKSNVAQLKKDREILSKKLSKKYSYIRSFINDIGFKSYEFGFSKDYIVGTLGVSILEKSQSNFGMDYYYLQLEYSPKPSDISDL